MTSSSAPKWVILFRLLAGAPLIAVGLQHLTGAAPLLPILEGTNLPMPELQAQLGPILQVLAGVLLVLGLWARLGALMAMGAMAAALYTHFTFREYTPEGASEAFSWPDEPPLWLPLGVVVSALIVLLRGAGAFSVDER